MFTTIMVSLIVTASVAFLGFLGHVSIASLRHPNINNEW